MALATERPALGRYPAEALSSLPGYWPARAVNGVRFTSWPTLCKTWAEERRLCITSGIIAHASLQPAIPKNHRLRHHPHRTKRLHHRHQIKPRIDAITLGHGAVRHARFCHQQWLMDIHWSGIALFSKEFIEQSLSACVQRTDRRCHPPRRNK